MPSTRKRVKRRNLPRGRGHGHYQLMTCSHGRSPFSVVSRRRFLQFGLPVAGGLIAGLPFRAWAGEAGPAEPPASDTGRYLIVNADDLGLGTSINRGIFETHARGILTSASLMVTGRAVDEAVREARNHPRLSTGCTSI
jgi:hypothetical protein